MRTSILLTRGLAGAALAVTLIAADRPLALAGVSPGLWEIRQVPSKAPVRICLADVAFLAQYEHRAVPCTRVVIRDQPESALIHYSCAGGGFGRTKITPITPRSLRIETQGISKSLPFNYLLNARRLGDCAAH